jgi:hypothetical protein
MYVTTTTTIDSIAVAGVVVSPSIVNQSVGSIAIWGPVKAKTGAAGIAEATAVSTTNTAKLCAGYANTSTDDGYLGWCLQNGTNATLGGGADACIIFVNPGINPS